MADCHEILLGAGKGSQDAHPCLLGHAHTSSLVLWDGLPVPLRVLSLGCSQVAMLAGETCTVSVQGVYTCCSAGAGALCGGSMQGLPFLPASQISAHAVSSAHGTLLSCHHPAYA